MAVGLCIKPVTADNPSWPSVFFSPSCSAMAINVHIVLPLACLPFPESRYREREVGGGRATRQPGQIRKEAALTRPVRVIGPTSHPRFARNRALRHNRTTGAIFYIP